MNPSDPAGPSTPAPSVGNRPSASRRRGTAKRRRLWIWGLVAIAVLGGVIWKFVLPRLKEMRAQHFAAEAEALIRREEYSEALAKILAALRFAPRDPAVLRSAARLCAESRSPNGLRYYESLIKIGAATPEDRKGYVKLALALNRMDIAGRELAEMLKTEPKNLELLHLLIQQQQEAKDLNKATKTAGYALSLRPDDAKTQFLFGSLLLQNRTNSYRTSGRRTLWGLALTDGEYSDPAAEILMRSPELSNSEIRLLIRDLQSRTNLRPTDVLRAYELKIRLEPERTNALVREVFKTMSATNSSPELLSLLSTWASQKRQPELVLEMVSADLARTNVYLAPIRAFALAQTGHWSELIPVLEDKRYPLDPTVANVLRGEMALSSGNRAEAEAAFKTALEQPKLAPNRILLVAHQAELAGFPLIAVSAYQRLMGTPGQTVPAALEILQVLNATNDTRQVGKEPGLIVKDLGLIRDTLKKLNDQLPGDDAIAGERAWAELLMNNRLKESRLVAERLAANKPGDPQWRFLLALARLRENQPAEALTLIESESANWDQLRPRWQAVYVAALGANQQREAARTFARKVNTTWFRSAEKDLVTPYL